MAVLTAVPVKYADEHVSYLLTLMSDNVLFMETRQSIERFEKDSGFMVSIAKVTITIGAREYVRLSHLPRTIAELQERQRCDEERAG